MKLMPRKISKVAVIGGGLMSSEIATMLVLRNYQLVLKHKNKTHLLDEISRIKENLQNCVKNGRADQQCLEKSASLLKGVVDYDNFNDVDLVIEAESEDLSLKQEIFANLEKFCPQHCIFTSNSSKFSLKLIGERSKCPNRIAQIRFFCLSHVLPLMEIVRTENTLPQVVVDLIDLGRKMRKTPIVVIDRQGYTVNSMFVTYLHAAILLTEGGVDAYQIDQALKSFGMQLGPFRIIDIVGFQAFAEISKILVESLPDRSYKPKLISILQQEGHEGECNGKGFYKYDHCSKASQDPELRKYIEKAQNISNATIASKLTKLSDAEIVEMILFPALNEACRIISEGVVIRSSDLDVASVFGMGFPSYRGGIVYWSNSFGSDYVYSKLERWAKEYGDFFKPCDYIGERSTKRISLANEIKRAKSQL
ncbi:Hydroxyacyl-CoA dehydrogenase/enoyl-CoA hydratase [Handroanthus impetiginosus]|uniref:Hydroxyacyl-CoA dehydrogenase/enoyl-CoA hydratase n=1 Tax=Handroanthus impetiginosus TaxID=429701 RepID=A0A2G9FY20_9LAMI|nr:Hydroxyacyl-CoA dehydrogenase/enoyl-CoA hydratase [Handroanthus impetiginosus]